MTHHSRRKTTSTWQILISVLSALFGVQSDENRHHDFKRRSPIPFILVGIVMIAFLVLGLVTLVQGITAG